MKKHRPLWEKVFETRTAAEAAARKEKRKRPGALVQCWPRNAGGCRFDWDPDGDAPADYCVEVWNLPEYLLSRFDGQGMSPEEIAAAFDGWMDAAFVSTLRKGHMKRKARKPMAANKRNAARRRAEQVAAFRRLEAAHPGTKKEWLVRKLAARHPRKTGWKLRTLKRNLAGV